MDSDDVNVDERAFMTRSGAQASFIGKKKAQGDS